MVLVALWATPALAGGVSAQVEPPDDGVSTGDQWQADVRVTFGARRDTTEGMQPFVTIRNGESGRTETFKAVATGEPGSYRAAVTFPSEGAWSYSVEERVIGRTFDHHPDVTVAAPGGSRANPVVPAALLALAAAAAMVLVRSIGRRPAPALAVPGE